jgi:membrane protease YdiL (CAAX protease family)
MNVFYNSAQRRIRAAWRLVLLAVLFLAPALLATSAVPQFLAAAWGGKARPYLAVILGLLLVAVILFNFWLAARFFDRRPFRDFGFHFDRAWWRDLVFGLALGAALMLAIFLVQWAAGWISVRGTLAVSGRGVSFAGALILGTISFVCVGIYEELFARGYLMRNLAEGLRWRFISPRAALLLAYLLSSLLFGLAHQGGSNAGPLTTLHLALAGLFLGLGYLLTGELALPIGLHITWNLFQGYVFGFPVSGTGHEATVIAVRQGGPAAWTGGAYGPEGGWIGLLALLAGSLAIVAWVRLTRGTVQPQDRLATYEPPVPAAGTAPFPGDPIQSRSRAAPTRTASR